MKTIFIFYKGEATLVDGMRWRLSNIQPMGLFSLNTLSIFSTAAPPTERALSFYAISEIVR